MIGRLTGKVLECSPEDLLLDVAGVGYALRIPLSTYYHVVNHATPDCVSVHVHTHVREDALQLYGFAVAEERTVFQRLISISGVGPRIALAILSGIGTSELRVAVASKDRGRLQKIPGVGKKTAERLLLELRDKLVSADPSKAVAGESGEGGDGVPDPEASDRLDAVSALTNLGYSEVQAERAIDRTIDQLDKDTTLEAILKSALRGLNG